MNATILQETRCEWIVGKGQDYTTCKETAQWEKGQWKLCDHHKQRLIESYNAGWRAKEAPGWTRI